MKASDAVYSRADVSRETLERFEIYIEILRRWQSHTNLISRHTMETVWERHIDDSIQLLALAPMAKRWIDMGSGAGFPGLVLAMMRHDHDDFKIHLIESNGKKCTFLKEVIQATSIPAIVHQGRIEAILPVLVKKKSPEILTARALASLPQLLHLVDEVLKTPIRALFMKGRTVQQELTDSMKWWSLDYRLHPSATSAESCIVEIIQAERR